MLGCRFDEGHRNHRSVLTSFAEFDDAVCQCEERVILAHADVLTRMVNRTPLANDDVAGDGWLATEDLYAQALAVRVAAVLYTAFTFLMCHGNLDF
jgi:hypothetical protein